MSETRGIVHLVSNPLTLSFSNERAVEISELAKSSGLNSDNLEIICSWIESEETDEACKLQLIECLIPEPNGGTIPELMCIRLSYLLKTSKISVKTKVELLKWMICAYPFMNTDGRFEMLYEMFLSLLKDKELGQYTAHFLYLITQKKQVTFRRVKFLFSCINDLGNNSPCYKSLLKAYFLLAPECFEDEFEEESSCQFEPLGAYPSLIRKVHHAYKPNFSNIIITTSQNSCNAMFSEYDVMSEKSSEATTPNLSPFHQLYKEYRILERSTNISDILKSKHSYLFLTSRLNRVMQIKIEDYILSMLHEDYESEGLVEKYSEFFQYRSSFPGFSEFTEFLLIKDLCDPDIIEALCYEPVCCFKKIQYKLQLVRGKFLTTDDIELKCQWLNSLSKMLCYWILQVKNSVPCDGTCNEEDSDSSDTPLHHVPSTEINQLGSEIDFLCDSLIMEDSSPFVLYEVLQHYQMVTIARIEKEKNVAFCFPSAAVFQLSLFSLTPFILDYLSEFILRINLIHNSKTHALKNEESIIFQASCNDIKKIFMGGSYKSESTYLAKTKTFKKLIKRSSEFKNSFILYKHPALFLTTLESEEIDHAESILTNPACRKKFLFQLAENDCKDFVKLISKIK